MEALETLTPTQNALDSLHRIARDLEAGSDQVLHLKSILLWGWHAVGLLAYMRLQSQKGIFDSWVQDYLHEGAPELEVERDAYWEERERLSFLELLDILSQVDLPILKADFYQGWQDRTSRCRWLRQQVNDIVGDSIRAEQRDRLMYLLAAYHRLVRLPAGVSLPGHQISKALPALLDLAEMLVDQADSSAKDFRQAISTCRRTLTDI